MTKKFLLGLATLVVGSTLAAGGVAIAGYATENIDPVDPSATTSYTMTIDADNPLVFDATDTSVATANASPTSGLSIGFKTSNAAAMDGYAVNFPTVGRFMDTSKYASIHNTDPINGIKSIKITLGGSDTSKSYAPLYFNLIYGYSPIEATRVIDLVSGNNTVEYDRVGFYSGGQSGTYEYSFLESIAPNYFAIVFDNGNTGDDFPDGKNQKVKSIEITYSCETLSDSVTEVTASSRWELYQSMLYYRNVAPSIGGTIHMGADISIDKPLYIYNESGNIFKMTLDTNGHTLSAGNPGDLNSWNYNHGLFDVYSYYNASNPAVELNITGNGTIDANGYPTYVIATNSSVDSSRATVNISNVTFLATPGYPAIYARAYTGTHVVYQTPATFNISGGTFKNRDDSASDNLLSLMEGKDNTIHVTGGYFLGFDPSEFLGESSEGVVKSVASVDETTSLDLYTVSILTTGLPTTLDSPATYSLGSNVTVSSTITVSADITIIGHGHSIAFDDITSAAIYQTSGTLTIKNATLNLENISSEGSYSHTGILVNHGVINLDTVTFVYDQLNLDYSYAMFIGGEGESSLKDVTVSATSVVATDSGSHVYIGPRQVVTVEGGNLGRVAVDATDLNSLSAGHVILVNAPTIESISLKWLKNSRCTYGDYGYNKVYIRATWSGTKADATTINDNSDGLDVTGLVDVTTYVSTAEQFNTAVGALASIGGTINVISDFTIDQQLLVAGGNITVNGNGHTVTYDGTATFTGPALYHTAGTLNINDMTFDFAGITDKHGIMTRGVMNLDTVTVSNFSAEAINAYKIPVYFYGSGVTEGSLTNCTVDSNVETYSDPSYAEVWIGALRDITISGGSYGKIFVNAYENKNSQSFNSASLTIEGGASADLVVAECEASVNAWKGTKDGTESTYEAGSIIYHANLKIADGCNIASVNANPDNITGVTTSTSVVDGYTVYGWSVSDNLTLAEDLSNLSVVA